MEQRNAVRRNWPFIAYSCFCCLLFREELLAAEVEPKAARLEERSSRSFVMQPASSYTDDSAEPQIIGGKKANPLDWPATFVFHDAKGTECTSTLVGSRVVITAAHCVENNATGKLLKIDVLCSRHPSYQAASSNEQGWREKTSPDFALCLLSKPVSGGEFEYIDGEGNNLTKDESIHLLGFGCNKNGGSDGGFGVLYEGESTIQSVSRSPTDYYITTETGAAVCYGDSGGGAYQFLNVAKTRRMLVGINSRGDIAKLSYLSSTSADGFIEWAKNWSAINKVTICGLHQKASGCRPK